MTDYTDKVRAAVEAMPTRSAWSRGVKAYAMELLEDWERGVKDGYIATDDVIHSPAGHKALLNGADDWHMFSEGGCSLAYDDDIALRLCSPSEMHRAINRRDGQPNRNETWLDVQARALYQAERKLIDASKRVA